VKRTRFLHLPPELRGYSAKILADSIGPNSVRLTTWELTYPRFVHAELMTHRLLSRNSASSRAIPTKKLMKQIRECPAMPVWWGKNQSGMQAREELTGWRLAVVMRLWLWARWGALLAAWTLSKLGFHKQIANRLLEPWMFITVICTATEWDNWFRLRCHPDAQPEIGWVAKEMKRQYDEKECCTRVLSAGEWHLPLIDFDDEIKVDLQDIDRKLCKVSAGRCARVSYLTHDGRRDMEEDVKLSDRLMASGHWSPFEHVAQALPKMVEDPRSKYADGDKVDSSGIWSGNLRGWLQYRETVDATFTKVGR
jgi:thymidylate synthase ThyX